MRPGDGRRMIPRLPRKCCSAEVSERKEKTDVDDAHLVIQQNNSSGTHRLVPLMVRGRGLYQQSVLASNLGRHVVKRFDIR